MLCHDEILKILNKNDGNRKYSKEDGKELYKFINAIATHFVAVRLKKIKNEKK